MKYLTVFLVCASNLCAVIDENKLYNYCTDTVDRVSYQITHSPQMTDNEKAYLIGEMQCLSHIVGLLDDHYFDLDVSYSVE